MPLAWLRARGQLVELRLGALCFTEEETAEFLPKGLGLTLSAEQVGIAAHLLPYLLLPGGAEILLAPWLVVMGVNTRRWQEQAAATHR